MDVPVLLIEFEGVLADTHALRRSALAEALAADGIMPNDELLDLGHGRSIEEGILRIRAAAGAPDDYTAVELTRLRAERAFAMRAGKGLSLAPHVKPALEKLGVTSRLALVTRASRREVDFVLELAGLDGLFRPIITLDDVRPPKPDRAPYLATINKVGQLFPGQTLRALAVEDSVPGVRTARELGIPSVLVGSVPAHEAMEADAWVPSLADLTPDRVRTLVGHGSERKP